MKSDEDVIVLPCIGCGTPMPLTWHHVYCDRNCEQRAFRRGVTLQRVRAHAATPSTVTRNPYSKAEEQRRKDHGYNTITRLLDDKFRTARNIVVDLDERLAVAQHVRRAEPSLDALNDCRTIASNLLAHLDVLLTIQEKRANRRVNVTT